MPDDPATPDPPEDDASASADAPEAADMAPEPTDMAATAAMPAAPPPPKAKGAHRILVQVIIVITTILAVVGIFAVWANRQLLNPDNWAGTSTRLLQHEEIRSATANYLVDQLYANVDVAGTLSERLPPILKPLAGPAAGALRNAAVTITERALANPKVQDAWRIANRTADQTLVNVVNGGSDLAKVQGGVVTLNLAAILSRVSDQLGIPDLSSKLPPNVAELKILSSKQLKVVQDGGKALKGLALLLTILVPLLYALAIFLARGNRRRTLMEVGFAMIIAGLLVFAARKLVESGVTNSLVKVQSNRPAAETVLSIATEILGEIAGAFVIVGIPVVAAGWFAGPAKWATSMRRAIAPFMRDDPVATFGIVAAVMILIFIWGPIPATHRPVGIIVFFALAMFGTAVLRRETEREFPGAS